ncbi:MAG: bifunctional adenosylcobinamide kinase/adenosylcobinamide-phosphate guanylyltransferase [Clostridiales bacterium]|nr:bifunctional adenosylcobinamide kinase/adenosylcobinamide-phosphate guanylyltransferase [Clostridiales bacterium]
MILITGGSGSGKSAYAEAVSVDLKRRAGTKETLVYVATMRPVTKEGLQRVKRHQAMREGKGFCTVECYENLDSLLLSEHSVVLLECMSNLLLNECGMGTLPDEMAGKRILSQVERLAERVEALVIVTNEIFSDGIWYDDYTREYQDQLAWLNKALANRADKVVEVVYSIPLSVKGELPCILS